MARGALVHPVDARGPCRVSTPLLVVEDDPRLRQMLAQPLEDEGYPVVAAADGLDAIEHLREGRPSLVLLDLNLPYVNGDAVGARVRARYGRAVPIVVVTADRDGAEIAETLRAEYLGKPFNIDDLLTIVWRCLERT